MARDSNLVTFSVFVASILFLVTPINGNNPLHVLCQPEKDNYTFGSPFRNNLEQLLGTLASSTAKTGFSDSSAGDGTDQVFGQALCRHDVDGSVCGDCIRTASQEIMSQCNKTDADIWYDYCQISYSYNDFFSVMTYQGKYPESNSQENVSNPDEQSTALKKLMNDLKSEATFASSRFAVGSSKFSSQERVYGLVQCTKGITGDDCDTCLRSALGDLTACCSPHQGGMVVSRYCNVRFELYRFYNLHSKGLEKARMISLVLGILAVALLLSLGVCVALRRQKKITTRDEEKEENVLLQELAKPIELSISKGDLEFSDDMLVMNLATLRAATAWILWNEGKELEFVDPFLLKSFAPADVRRTIQIGLLCVQEDPADRPLMTDVVVLLESGPSMLSQPKQPAFSVGRDIPLDMLLMPESSCTNDLTASTMSPR
ncbi:hypothetical protein NL676_007425 [Syzygium grande]|nr:hypothetical protein NL676_007425 [Syzygium grande]